MRLSRLPLLSTAVISLFTFSALAADTSLPNLSKALSSQAASKSAATAESTGAAETSGSNKDTASGQNTASNTGKSTGTATGTSTGPSPTGVITGSGSAGATTGTVPVITGGSSAKSGGVLPSGLPTLSGAFVIVAPSVPPTANAPFMRTSNLPEGTVFIVVGAVLGFMAMSVLLWRGLVAWSLHRSVKRAAIAQTTSQEKALFASPAAPFYQYKDRDSTISLGALGHKSKKSGRPTTAPGAASQANLFFSPTATAAGNSVSSGNRGSNYLPAGYYAAGAAQPGNGQGLAHIGHGSGNIISMSNLGPARDGYSRARSIGTSPPSSPAWRPSTNHGHAASSSTLNLSQNPGEQRAPSAYLDDLFDGEGAPPVPGSAQHLGSQQRF